MNIERVQCSFLAKRLRATLSAPYFDVNDLSSQLNESGLLTSKTVQELVDLIVQKNHTYIEQLSPAQVRKCTDGFYLCYKHPKCSWMNLLRKC